MIQFLGLLALSSALVAAATSKVLASHSDLAAAAAGASVVHILDFAGNALNIDGDYASGSEFTPVISYPEQTAAPGQVNNEDWILVPGSSNAEFMLQSAAWPSLFLSYSSFGVGGPGAPGIHAQLVVREEANAPFWTFTASGLVNFNITVQGTPSAMTSWAGTLADGEPAAPLILIGTESLQNQIFTVASRTV